MLDEAAFVTDSYDCSKMAADAPCTICDSDKLIVQWEMHLHMDQSMK